MEPAVKLGRFRRVAEAALALAVAAGVAACSSAALPASAAVPTPSKPVAPAPPPKDDGKTAEGGPAASSNDVHSAALEQLKVAPTGPRIDKQASIIVPLPDPNNWTRVRFLTVKSLVGFRYGKAHHAIVGGFTTHVDDNMAEGACTKSFEQWATPWVEAFEVDLHRDPPAAFPWTVPPPPAVIGGAKPGPIAPKTVAILDVDVLMAKTATILSRENYAAAWTVYPAWPKTCLVIGVAVPSHDDEARAREVRDRFVKDVFPHVRVTAAVEPKELY